MTFKKGRTMECFNEKCNSFDITHNNHCRISRNIVDCKNAIFTPQQPAPVKSDSPAMWDLVKLDIESRDCAGVAKYGTRLQANNGRDVLRDAYEEALDLCVYLRQAIYERDGR